MRNKAKRIVSALCALALCTAMLPVQAFAGEEINPAAEDTLQEQTEQEGQDGNTEEAQQAEEPAASKEDGEAGSDEAGGGTNGNDTNGSGTVQAPGSEQNNAEPDGEEPVEEPGSAGDGVTPEVPDVEDGGNEEEESLSTSTLSEMDGATPVLLAAPREGDDTLEAHVVKGTLTPKGTTIDLFDYWLNGQDESDYSNPGDYQIIGINEGHVLHFGKGIGSNNPTSAPNSTTVNYYTQTAEPRQGIVEKTMSDGYPKLASTVDSNQESLAYLFNSTNDDGKAAYMNVEDLLQVDKDGYFYYDCTRNFASFDATTSKFTLYDKGAVNKSGSSAGYQFFPFNTANQVFANNGDESFEVGDDEKLVAKSIQSDNNIINHYFGLHMSTQFIQQDGGKTSDGNPVTYNFSGDDDVWVFIDGVLVGDLGGIHDTTSLQIDFSTGEIVVYRDGGSDGKNDGLRNNAYDDGETTFETPTLKEKFEDANVSTIDFDKGSNTFADGTTHTLDFFYLERGNVDSNMRLKYNLVSIPDSGIVKQDQNGTLLKDVNFKLYKADKTDEGYIYTDNAPYYEGTTDANGTLTFTKAKEADSTKTVPITMAELHRQSTYWVLVEDEDKENHDTYRLPGPIHLRFYGDKVNTDGNITESNVDLLLSDNAWETGTYAQPHVTVRAGAIPGNDPDNEKVMFAVVKKKVGENDWRPVSGSAEEGWTVAKDDTDKSIWEAAQANQTFFEVESSGAYALTINDLPGDVTKYEYILQQTGGNPNDAQYRVAYYTATAPKDAENPGSINEIMNVTDFTRTFSVTLTIANVELTAPTLHKTDESGKPLKDVTFALYETGPDFDTTGVTPLRTLTTEANGNLTVTDSEQLGVTTISKGYYVLEETYTPKPYVLESTPIQIVVNDDGVFVNAGSDTDNVTVELGIGSLVNSMKGFAAADDVDATLHDVQAQPQTGTWNEETKTFTWDESTNATALHLCYTPPTEEDESGVLPYGPTPGVSNNAATYTAAAGWTRLNITQCLDQHGTDSANKQNLGGQSLNALFTGSTVIHVVNSKPKSPEEPPKEPPENQETPPATTPAPQPTPATAKAVAAPAAAAPAATAVPQTSDDMPLGALTATAVAAAAAFVALLVVRKRRQSRD